MRYAGSMVFKIAFNEEKNQLLKATRGISFDEVISAIDNNGLLADIATISMHIKECMW
jgi:hypothetical protein